MHFDPRRCQPVAAWIRITRFVADSTRFYMEFHDEYQKIEGCVINDPLALALTFAPELCTYQELHVDVDLSGGFPWARQSPIFTTMAKGTQM